MVQKKYNNTTLEITLNMLEKSESHIRQIAKDLQISHTTIIRKIEELVNENVLDFKIEGRNKVFFLKKTINARNYVYMAENYKTKKILDKYPELSIIIKEILNNAKSNLIVLFGSYAKFNVKLDSDIDIFIETKDSKLKEKLKQINRKISLKIGDFDLNNILIKEIIKSHVILKGVEVFYEKTRFFE